MDDNILFNIKHEIKDRFSKDSHINWTCTECNIKVAIKQLNITKDKSNHVSKQLHKFKNYTGLDAAYDVEVYCFQDDFLANRRIYINASWLNAYLIEVNINDIPTNYEFVRVKDNWYKPWSKQLMLDELILKFWNAV